MTEADTVTIAAIEAGVPTLVAARALTERFHTMVRKKDRGRSRPWIAAASQSLIASFASGITKDIAAVHAALIQPWSNGQTEGQSGPPTPDDVVARVMVQLQAKRSGIILMHNVQARTGCAPEAAKRVGVSWL